MIFYNNNKEEAEKNMEQVYELLAEILIESESDNNEKSIT